MESHKRRLHRIDNGIAEREIFFLRSAYCVSLPQPTPRMAMLSEDMSGTCNISYHWSLTPVIIGIFFFKEHDCSPLSVCAG